MKFYARAPGCRSIMPNGKVMTFVGGVYETEDKDEIKELSAIVKEGYYSLTPVPIVQSDAHLLKEIGKKSGTGPVNSATIAALSADSSA